MQDPKDIIIESLKKWLSGNNIEVDFEVSLVSNPQFGDFSSNVAMVAIKKSEKSNNPRELAEKIVLKLKESDQISEIFEKIEVAGTGFINFFLSSTYLKNLLLEIEKRGPKFGRVSKEIVPVSSEGMRRGEQKIMVEFGDPNPFKEIHIGHLRNFCIGESYSRLLESQGNTVVRANYQGDVGLHVAKCLFGILQNSEFRIQNLELKVEDLAKGYVLGAKKYEENENPPAGGAKLEIQSLNKKIYEMVDADSARGFVEPGEIGLKKLWEEGRKISLESFEKLYQRIGISYQKSYFESVTAKKGKEIVLQHIDDGIFEKSDGAIVYRGEKDGLHTRVFLTSQNYATYEAKDLALAVLKNEDGEFGKSVILTGNEQLEYFQVMLAALKKINSEIAQKTKHFSFGHVRLKEGKMSSRTGDVVAAQWLLDEAVLKVRNAFPEMDSATAEKVGVGAVKYSMLKFSVSQDIHFSFEESISLEGNSGPYLMYSFVRTRSVLEKSKEQKAKSKEEGEGSQVAGRGSQDRYFSSEGRSLTTEENELLRFLVQYEYVLEQATNEFAPNLLCNYLFELSQKFNLFYQKHKILGAENEEFRLKLTQAVGQVLKNGLIILGIETVEKM